ncbi:MAG TPA: SDR family oxidoreductase [Steroidobacteraceae bacterium]|nr:SDR family oxidoreductase [Steroidobacteraceae bacterium]
MKGIIVVTGASSGFGRLTAEALALDGHTVYAAMRETAGRNAPQVPGALAALTRGLARDLGPRGVTVNVIQPGPTETGMNPNADSNATLRTLMAIGRMGKDTEIASLVAYLASPEASFITGAAITIDGGYLA